jgi:hypothetical protein
VSARDFGTKWSGTVTDSTGNTSSAVVVYGSVGPLELTVHAEDTRGAGAQMDYAVYVNSAVAIIRGTSTGHIRAPYRDVVGNLVMDLGMINMSNKALNINVPLVAAKGIGNPWRCRFHQRRWRSEYQPARPERHGAQGQLHHHRWHAIPD